MKTILHLIYTSCLSLLIFTLIFGGLYPFIAYEIGQILFPFQANGSLIIDPSSQQILGSQLIGQNFSQPYYFHPRPSAASQQGYDASQSASSQLPPISKRLIERVSQLTNSYRKENSLPSSIHIPIDAVTASASGLDPNIFYENALLQASRVAKARGVTIEAILHEINNHVEGPSFGSLKTRRVHVLRLNQALDRVFPLLLQVSDLEKQ